MNEGKASNRNDYQGKTALHSIRLRWSWLLTPSVIIDLIRPLFEHPYEQLEPYVHKGQIIADIGCANGYYTFPIADLVGHGGKVYAVDLSEKCIQRIQKKAKKLGFQNIEAVAASVTEMEFIKDKSIDLVWADGLLCSLVGDRQAALKEIKRILKQNGQAYLTIGLPPLGFVDRGEWEEILGGFRVDQRGEVNGNLMALVSLNQEAIKVED